METERGDSDGAIATTTPKSSPRSASTMTNSPSLIGRGKSWSSLKHR